MAEGNPWSGARTRDAQRGWLILGDDLEETMQWLVAEWRGDKTDLNRVFLTFIDLGLDVGSSTGSQSGEGQKHGKLAQILVMVADAPKVHNLLSRAL